MDELDEDEDEKIDVNGVPFSASRDFLAKYGTGFNLAFGENREVVLSPVEA